MSTQSFAKTKKVVEHDLVKMPSCSSSSCSSFNKDSDWLAQHIQEFFDLHCAGQMASPLATTTCNVLVLDVRRDSKQETSEADYLRTVNTSSEDNSADQLSYESSSYSSSFSQTFRVDQANERYSTSETNPNVANIQISKLPKNNEKHSLLNAKLQTKTAETRENKFKNFVFFDQRPVAMKLSNLKDKDKDFAVYTEPLEGESKHSFGKRWTALSMKKLNISTHASVQITRLEDMMRLPISEGKIRTMEFEKDKVKLELKAYDQIFSCFYGSYPKHEEKEPLRPLYAYYRRVKSGLQHLNLLWEKSMESKRSQTSSHKTHSILRHSNSPPAIADVYGKRSKTDPFDKKTSELIRLQRSPEYTASSRIKNHTVSFKSEKKTQHSRNRASSTTPSGISSSKREVFDKNKSSPHCSHNRSCSATS